MSEDQPTKTSMSDGPPDTVRPQISPNGVKSVHPSTNGKPRANHRNQHGRKKSRRKPTTRKEGSNEEILLEDVKTLLSSAQVSSGKSTPYQPPSRFTETEVLISTLSSTGDGLGLSPDKNHVYVVPFSLPGDRVKAKLVNCKLNEGYTVADFLEVLTPSPQRDESLVKCPYFARCGGCAFQMLAYDEQLKHKKSIVERAYKNFSDLAPEHVPQIGQTIGSPLQYSYRTKLTPHFDGPPGRGYRKRGKDRPRAHFTECPPIGFNLKNRPQVLDVEDCPIGTDAVKKGLQQERANVAQRLGQYTNGATILVRESTTRIPQLRGRTEGVESEDEQRSKQPDPHNVEEKTYITDNKATSIEYIDSYIFENPAGAFFQNNNSILSPFTTFVRDHILPAEKPTTTLLDAYCGSGLFTITLASLFRRSIGIDISESSIQYARKNAQLNHTKNTTFHAATASAIFSSLPDDIDPDDTAVVIDPPRKGCDENFLRQLLEFGPRRVCYVSCNVHTQARDIGVLVEGLKRGATDDTGGSGASNKTRYRIESIRGFDFFPQTSHVEGVAMLERVGDEPV